MANLDDVPPTAHSMRACLDLRIGKWGFPHSFPGPSAISKVRLTLDIALGNCFDISAVRPPWRHPSTIYIVPNYWIPTATTMGNGAKIPDAWDDDDWEAQADRAAKEDVPRPEPEAPMTRAERLAKHAEEQRRLWQSAYVAILRSLTPRPLLTPHTGRHLTTSPSCPKPPAQSLWRHPSSRPSKS